MTEPSEVVSGTKLTQGIDPWVAMLLEIRQAMLASPASSDVEAAGVDRYSYAIWKFAKHAAIFYHQAEAEGNLKEYFKRIDKISRDRWPTFEEGALKKKVRSGVMAKAISTVTSIPSQHWHDVLDIDYDRVHRRNVQFVKAQSSGLAEQCILYCLHCTGKDPLHQRRLSVDDQAQWATSAAHCCDALWATTTSPNLRRGTVFGVAGGVVGGWRTISPLVVTHGPFGRGFRGYAGGAPFARVGEGGKGWIRRGAYG
ncbi:hypothetical protein BJ912DRAFT_925102 [Pholiota molesta]|nr:hypothetical protein BJ912DRAFT_925102 [Pholiota molesta]